MAQDFYINKLHKLVGSTVIMSIQDEEDGFFGLRLNQEGKLYDLWILRDDEGNGPGSFEIIDLASGKEI